MLSNFQAGNSVGGSAGVDLSGDSTRIPASQGKAGLRVLSLLPTRNNITAVFEDETRQEHFSWVQCGRASI